MTTIPLTYQPTNTSNSWIINSHKITITPVSNLKISGKGKKISDIIANRRASSPEAAASLRAARKKLSKLLSKEQTTTLQGLRLQKGLSQSDLALLINSQQSYIAKIERNGTDLRAKTINKLAKALDVTCDQIIKAIEINE